MDFSDLYKDDYFKERILNDDKRLKSFEQEKDFIKKYMNLRGKICDVGCSTGEFLNYIGWEGDKYGMEVNKYAIELATNNGFRFDKNILNQNDFFDIVVFRGTIQHLPNPFYYIENAYYSLKKGGYIVFLATPNMGSIYYKVFNTLPAIDGPLNFYIPSDITLSNALNNFKFDVLEIEKPYLDSPYSNFMSDHLKFIKKLLFRTNDKFAFWGNMMNIIARKK